MFYIVSDAIYDSERARKYSLPGVVIVTDEYATDGEQIYRLSSSSSNTEDIPAIWTFGVPIIHLLDLPLVDVEFFNATIGCLVHTANHKLTLICQGKFGRKLATDILSINDHAYKRSVYRRHEKYVLVDIRIYATTIDRNIREICVRLKIDYDFDDYYDDHCTWWDIEEITSRIIQLDFSVDEVWYRNGFIARSNNDIYCSPRYHYQPKPSSQRVTNPKSMFAAVPYCSLPNTDRMCFAVKEPRLTMYVLNDGVVSYCSREASGRINFPGDNIDIHQIITTNIPYDVVLCLNHDGTVFAISEDNEVCSVNLDISDTIESLASQRISMITTKSSMSIKPSYDTNTTTSIKNKQ